LKRLKQFWVKYFIQKDGDKKRIEIKKLILIFILLVSFFLFITTFFEEDQDTSYLRKSDRKLIIESNHKNSGNDEPKEFKKLEHYFKNQRSTQDLNRKQKKKDQTRPGPNQNIKYYANQIIINESIAKNKLKAPEGSTFIGKLISPLDSRLEHKVIRATVPYGFSFKGKELIPKNSILLGVPSYSTNSKRVFIDFNKGIDPEGREFPISAIVLDSSDYSVGLIGEIQENTTSQMVSAMGLSMVSGITEVLTQKETLGDIGVITPKSTLENAMYHGVSNVTDIAAKREMEKWNKEKPYVIVESGKELIIMLKASFNGILDQ